MEAYRRSLREKHCVTLRDLRPLLSGPAGEAGQPTS